MEYSRFENEPSGRKSSAGNVPLSIKIEGNVPHCVVPCGTCPAVHKVGGQNKTRSGRVVVCCNLKGAALLALGCHHPVLGGKIKYRALHAPDDIQWSAGEDDLVRLVA